MRYFGGFHWRWKRDRYSHVRNNCNTIRGLDYNCSHRVGQQIAESYLYDFNAVLENLVISIYLYLIKYRTTS